MTGEGEESRQKQATSQWGRREWIISTPEGTATEMSAYPVWRDAGALRAPDTTTKPIVLDALRTKEVVRRYVFWSAEAIIVGQSTADAGDWRWFQRMRPAASHIRASWPQRRTALGNNPRAAYHHCEFVGYSVGDVLPVADRHRRPRESTFVPKWEDLWRLREDRVGFADAVWQSYQRLIYAVAQYTIEQRLGPGRPEVVEDAVLAVIERILVSIHTFDPTKSRAQDPLAHWLGVVTQRATSRYIRELYGPYAPEPVEPGANQEGIADTRKFPPFVYRTAERLGQELEGPEGTAVRLWLEGRGFEEIAKIMGCSISTAFERVRRGRVRLACLMANDPLVVEVYGHLIPDDAKRREKAREER